MPYGHVIRKVTTVKGRLFRLDINKRYLCGDVFSRWVNLIYDNVQMLKDEI